MQATTISNDKPNYLIEPDWFEQFDQEVPETVIALGNDAICALLGIGSERLRIYVNHIQDFSELLEPFGWWYPPVKVENGRKSAKPRGLRRDSIRILYVFKKLVDTAGETTAIYEIYPAIQKLYAKHNERQTERRSF